MRYLHEVIGEATSGQREAVALHFGLHASTVYKWCEDPGVSGHPIPADRIVPLCQFLDDWRIVEYLAAQSGRVLIELPAACEPRKNIDYLSQMATEFADLLRESVKAAEDGVITVAEMKRIDKEGWELLRAVVSVMEYFRRQVTPKKECGRC